MNKRYLIDLTEDERTFLLAITSTGKARARKIKRANLLLMAAQKQHTERLITELFGVSRSTIYRTKRDFVEEGLWNEPWKKAVVQANRENSMPIKRLYRFHWLVQNHLKAVVSGH